MINCIINHGILYHYFGMKKNITLEYKSSQFDFLNIIAGRLSEEHLEEFKNYSPFFQLCKMLH